MRIKSLRNELLLRILTRGVCVCIYFYTRRDFNLGRPYPSGTCTDTYFGKRAVESYNADLSTFMLTRKNIFIYFPDISGGEGGLTPENHS